MSDEARIVALTSEANGRAAECDRLRSENAALRAENAAMRAREATVRHHIAMALRALAHDHEHQPTTDTQAKPDPRT